MLCLARFWWEFWHPSCRKLCRIQLLGDQNGFLTNLGNSHSVLDATLRHPMIWHDTCEFRSELRALRSECSQWQNDQIEDRPGSSSCHAEIRQLISWLCWRKAHCLKVLPRCRAELQWVTLSSAEDMRHVRKVIGQCCVPHIFTIDKWLRSYILHYTFSTSILHKPSFDLDKPLTNIT